MISDNLEITGTQTCTHLENLVSCDSCEDIQRHVRMESLAFLCDEKICHEELYERVWTSNKRLTGPSKNGVQIMRRYKFSLEVGPHDDLWAEHGRRFQYGNFVIPCCNVEALLTTKWAEYSICLLDEMRKSFFSRPSYQRKLFSLIYYKICITKQIMDIPIEDHKEYEYYYKFLKKLAVKNDFSTPEFLRLHDKPRMFPLDKYDYRVRGIVKNIIKMGMKLGLKINLPFKSKTYIIYPGQKCDIFMSLKTCPDDWPDDDFHKEITKYLPGQIPFKFKEVSESLIGSIEM